MAKPPKADQMDLFETVNTEPTLPSPPTPKTPVLVDLRESSEREASTSPPKVTRKRKPVQSKKQKKGSGLVPDGDVRLTANIREDLHLRLKIAAARQRTTIGELIEGLVERYI